jgi:hypothetical protein
MARLIEIESETLLSIAADSDRRSLSAEQIIEFNKSVADLIVCIASLEEVNNCKMKNAITALCDTCEVEPCGGTKIIT